MNYSQLESYLESFKAKTIKAIFFSAPSLESYLESFKVLPLLVKGLHVCPLESYLESFKGRGRMENPSLGRS